MNCLHICNDLLGSKVHENLYHNLANLNVEQTIYYPVRPHTITKIKTYKEGSALRVIASEPLHVSHRVLFRRKIKFLYNSLKSQTDLNRFDILQATTLFSDGALALKIHNEYKIPYIVTVRSTDISVFLRRRPDLRHLGLEILKKSSKVIFISNSLKTKFESHAFIKKHLDLFRDKSEVVYNGIDDYWIDNIRRSNLGEAFKIIYVGRLTARKNIKNLAHSVILLNQEKVKCELNIVGGGGEDEVVIKDLATSHRGIVNYLGAISDKNALKEVYRANHIFAMPSKAETFGLVYLEALSQALPVLYLKNEGIDGVFKEKVGERCAGDGISEIAACLKKLIMEYRSYDFSSVDFSDFEWKNIAQKYQAVYKVIIAEN